MTTKITKRDRYNSIIAILGDTNPDLVAFCQNEIALLDKKASKAKEAAANKKAEVDELTVAVQAALTDDYQTIADVAAAIEGEDVTTAKVSYRLNALVKAGVADKTEVTIPGGEGVKSRKVVAFKLAD